MKARADIPQQTLERQRRASDPGASAWVSANAGSGKTHVLTQRVLRLLYEEACAPSRILCLTFTKAAAANMNARIFNTLAEWVSLDDSALAKAIIATGAPAPADAGALDFARRLFARAVETPGGLKIQTLHAFCESLLHAAPFEANVAAGFRVIEETAQTQAIERAKTEALNLAAGNDRLAAALTRVADDAGLTFESLLRDALGRRRLFRAGATPQAGDSLRKTLGLSPQDTPEHVAQTMLEAGVAPERWPEIAAFLQTGTASDGKRGAQLLQAYGHWRAKRARQALDDYARLFFTEQGAPARNVLNAGLGKARPDLKLELEKEQVRLAALRDKLASAETAERTQALNVLLNAILDRYETIKAERQWLDFDDLIERARALLTRSSARWVLYKLDAGIDHILVDEAQDTSAAQWEILRMIAEDFFAGEGQSQRLRSFFAVGDEKQSIFSFQGAEPALFAKMQRYFADRARAAERAFAPIELHLSFRSAPSVLAAVDRVFSIPAHFHGLSAQADHVGTAHQALKLDAPGFVEIWDLIAPSAKPESRDWRLPLDFQDADDPPVAESKRIAREIARWLKPGSTERVMDKEGVARAIEPADIMILVRRRDAFFEAMIRALKENGVPVAGADRLTLNEHIAALDLLAIGKAALLPQDDLTLAVVLKSPLFGFDDDDLLALAPRRDASLWSALEKAAAPRLRAAFERLLMLRTMARKLSPFAFYAQILGAQGGRKAFLARLGPEAGDVIDEFLNLALAHERARAPALAAFIAEVEALKVSIKRDMEAAGAAVRVMTVHAAKGLEAKIVFLPDVCGAPQGRHDPKLFALDAPFGEDVLVWSPRAVLDCEKVAQARALNRHEQENEYRRLLYVAMTRAEERLYIGGYRGKNEPPAHCWRAMIDAALAPGASKHPAPWGGDDQVRRFGVTTTEAGPAATPALTTSAPAPDWLFAQARPEAPPRPPIAPSNALDGAEDRSTRETPSLSPVRARALIEGRAIHVLLQRLPALPIEKRRAAGEAYLVAQGLDPDQAKLAGEQALAIVEDARLADLFGENSLAEAAIAGTLTRANGETIQIAGQIDRLARTPDGVLIGEFKTGARPDEGLAPASYLRQLALYRAVVAQIFPNQTIRCFLVWTRGPRVDEIDSLRLDGALAEVLNATELA